MKEHTSKCRVSLTLDVYRVQHSLLGACILLRRSCKVKLSSHKLACISRQGAIPLDHSEYTLAELVRSFPHTRDFTQGFGIMSADQQTSAAFQQHTISAGQQQISQPADKVQKSSRQLRRLDQPDASNRCLLAMLASMYLELCIIPCSAHAKPDGMLSMLVFLVIDEL